MKARIGADRPARVATHRLNRAIQVQMAPPAGPAQKKYFELFLRDTESGLEANSVFSDELPRYKVATQAIEDAGFQNEVPVLDIAQELQKKYLDSRDSVGEKEWLTLFRDRMHLSVKGNKEVALALCELLRTRNFVSG